MAKKNLRQISVAGLIGASALFPANWLHAGGIELRNTSTTPSVGNSFVQFSPSVADSTNGIHSNPSFDVYYEDSLSNHWYAIKMTNTESKSFNCPLAYYGTITNGTRNALVFRNIGSAPYLSNQLAAAKMMDGSYTNAIDVKKEISNAGGVSFTNNLPNALGGTNGQRYGLLVFSSVPLNEDTKGKITDITRTFVGADTSTYTISAELPNGTSNTLYRAYAPNNIAGSGTAVTNFYAPVTIGNFDQGSDTYILADTVSNNVGNVFWAIGESVAY
jgi:hypothetical protein